MFVMDIKKSTVSLTKLSEKMKQVKQVMVRIHFQASTLMIMLWINGKVNDVHYQSKVWTHSVMQCFILSFSYPSYL